jgi:hypothetical protein
MLMLILFQRKLRTAKKESESTQQQQQQQQQPRYEPIDYEEDLVTKLFNVTLYNCNLQKNKNINAQISMIKWH